MSKEQERLSTFTDILDSSYVNNSQPLSLSSGKTDGSSLEEFINNIESKIQRPERGTGQEGHFRSREEIDDKYRDVFIYPYFNLIQSKIIDDALYSDKSLVVCAPTGSGKTVVFEMAIVQLLMEIEDKKLNQDFKIIYMAPVKALCTERLTEWYPKFTKLGLLCIEVTGDTDVDFPDLKPYRIIITTPEKWDMLTRRWKDHSSMVDVIKLFLIDEVHILNDNTRGPVLEAVVSRMKAIESSAKSVHRIKKLQRQYQNTDDQSVIETPAPKIRFIAVSATVSNPEDVANWLGTAEQPAVFYKFGDECRPVKLKLLVEGYPCAEGSSIFKFDIILNYKLWQIIQKYHNKKPTLIFCNTRKSVALTAEILSREMTVNFSDEQKARLTALASSIKNKKLQSLILCGLGCHHAGLLYEERVSIENAFRNMDLPILITTTTLAMGVNLPAHLVIIKNTQQYVNGTYQEYSISTILQMVGRAGRPQFDTEATAVIMTRLSDKARYQSIVGGSEPLQSYLHKRLAENLNSEAALGTVNDVAQCVQWVNSTFLSVRAARDPRRYLGLPNNATKQLISKKIEELCVKAMNSLATSGLITMDEASCIESTDAGRLMSVYYIDVETMKTIMKIGGSETLERLLWLICESHELSDMHLRVDERRSLNTLNRNNTTATIRFPMKGKICTRQMKLNCIIQAVLGCLPIPDPSLNQEAMKIMRIADRVCKCLVAYVTSSKVRSGNTKCYLSVVNAILLAKCISAHLWENSPYLSKQLKGIGPTFSSSLASAGKVTFMLLEESHPRDLERIMNKGPPAGNVLRKQISLLPKYRLNIAPADDQSVRIEMVLLNHAYLLENIEHLTVGSNHKFYLIVGDSENNLLYFAAFKDSDLLNVYDGCITCVITRKHNNEHKILVNCISSNFVGIDDSCEFLFKGLSIFEKKDKENIHNTSVIHSQKQTLITDAFKRKRKLNRDHDFFQSQEKKKRDSNLIKQYKHLKQSLDSTVKCSKEKELTNKADSECSKPVVRDKCDDKYNYEDLVLDNVDTPDVDDGEIMNVLKEIESEMASTSSMKCCNRPVSKKPKGNAINKVVDTPAIKNDYFKGKTPKSNFSFIDSIKKKECLDNENTYITQTDTAFSSVIKDNVRQFMENIQNKFNNKSLTDFDKTLISSRMDSINSADCETSKNTKHLTPSDVKPDNCEDKRLPSAQNVNKNELLMPSGTDSIKNSDCATSKNEVGKSKVMHKTNVDEGLPYLLNDLITNNINDDNRKEIVNYKIDDDSHSTEQFIYNNIPRNDFKESCFTNKAVQIVAENIELNNKNDELSLVIPSCNKIRRSIVRFDTSSDKDRVVQQKINNLSTIQLNPNTIPLPAIDNIFNRQNNVNGYRIFEIALPSDCENKIQSPENVSIQDVNTVSSFGGSNRNRNEKHDTINKYSFTATQVNACTKTLPERKLHIVSRVKIDLDVTEIRTRQHNLNESYNFEDDVDIGIDKSKTLESSSVNCDVNKSHNEYIDSTCFSSVKVPNFNTKLKELQTTSVQDEKCQVEELERSKSPVSINDILEKYQTKLSISKNKTPVLSPVKNFKNDLNKCTVKPRRLYKISDLNKVDIPLPNSLTSVIFDTKNEPVNKTVSSVLPMVIPDADFYDPNLRKCLDEQITELPKAEYSEAISKSENSPNEISDDDLNDSPPNPVIEDLNDFEVTQALLNPKTLIQSVQSDEIIPPPPEFSDSTYSPMFDDYKSNYDLIDTSSILQDISNNEVAMEIDTTGPEVEMWTLSTEDENYSPVYSPPQDTYISQPPFSLTPNLSQRHVKLNRFKFTRKSNYTSKVKKY